MTTLLVVPKNHSELKFIEEFLRKIGVASKELSEKALEDFHFAQLIDEGMKSENVSLSKLRIKLRK
jgi:hypothetical protein